MQRIINSTCITLDGVIASPQHWPSGRVSDDAGVAIQAELLIMGRYTYDSFAAAWPSRSGDPISDRINSMAKYVVSSTLPEADWHNTTIITGDPVGAIARLKQQPGQDFVQYGFGQLSYALMHHGLLDELRLVGASVLSRTLWT